MRSEDQILVKVACPFPPPWARGAGTGYVFRSRERLGSRRYKSPTPQVRQPRGSQTRPPSGEVASAHRYRDGGSPAAAQGRDRAGLPGSPASTRRYGSSPRTGAFPGGRGAGTWSRPCYGAVRRSLVTAVAKGAAPGRHQHAPPWRLRSLGAPRLDVISARRHRRAPPPAPSAAGGKRPPKPP